MVGKGTKTNISTLFSKPIYKPPNFSMMKKVFILFSVVASVVFTSCSKDDDKQITPESELVGSWRFTADLSGENDEQRSEATGCNAQNLLIFKSNQTFEYVEYDSVDQDDTNCKLSELEKETGVWTISSDGVIDFTFDGEDDSSASEYAINGDELTLGFQDGTDIDYSVYTKQ